MIGNSYISYQRKFKPRFSKNRSKKKQEFYYSKKKDTSDQSVETLESPPKSVIEKKSPSPPRKKKNSFSLSKTENLKLKSKSYTDVKQKKNKTENKKCFDYFFYGYCSKGKECDFIHFGVINKYQKIKTRFINNIEDANNLNKVFDDLTSLKKNLEFGQDFIVLHRKVKPFSEF